jgi:hypothetical protein
MKLIITSNDIPLIIIASIHFSSSTAPLRQNSAHMIHALQIGNNSTSSNMTTRHVTVYIQKTRPSNQTRTTHNAGQNTNTPIVPTEKSGLQYCSKNRITHLTENSNLFLCHIFDPHIQWKTSCSTYPVLPCTVFYAGMLGSTIIHTKGKMPTMLLLFTKIMSSVLSTKICNIEMNS